MFFDDNSKRNRVRSSRVGAQDRRAQRDAVSLIDMIHCFSDVEGRGVFVVILSCMPAVCTCSSHEACAHMEPFSHQPA